MGSNAALNFGAAVMQVKDLQAQFGGLSAVVAKVGAFVAANALPIGAAVAAIRDCIDCGMVWMGPMQLRKS
jgi:hypothetical protein